MLDRGSARAESERIREGAPGDLTLFFSRAFIPRRIKGHGSQPAESGLEIARALVDSIRSFK